MRIGSKTDVKMGGKGLLALAKNTLFGALSVSLIILLSADAMDGVR
jgi:hypothetical protein